MKFRNGSYVVIYLICLLSSASCASDSRESRRSNSLISSLGISEVSTSKRPIDVDDMMSLRDLGGLFGQGLSVSPDGKHVAFQLHRADLGKNAYEVGWFVMSLFEPGQPTFLGSAGDPLLFRSKDGSRINGAWESIDPMWSADSKWIAYRRMDDQSIQIWRSKIDGSAQEQITHNNGSVESFLWTDDGTRIFFEVDSSPMQQAEFIASKWRDGLWVGDDYFVPNTMQYQLQAYELTGGRPQLWVLDVPSRQERHARKDEIDSYFETSSLSSDVVFLGSVRSSRMPGRPLSQSVVVSGDNDDVAWLESDVKAVIPALRVWAKQENTEAREVRCQYDECYGYITEIWWVRNNRELVFIRREAPNKTLQVIYGWNISNNVTRKIYIDPERHLSGCSSTGHELVCFSDSPAKPRVLVTVSLVDGVVRELFDPNPEFAQLELGEAEYIEWRTDSGSENAGYIVKPVDYLPGERYPLVILQYRARSCFKGGTGDEYPAHLFAAAGFVVLCFDQPDLWDLAAATDVIGHQKVAWKDFYGKRTKLLSLEAAIEFLDQKGLIDPAKVGITGLSSGADTISYALGKTDRFATAISSGGGWSPNTYYTLPGWARSFSRDIGFGRPGSPEDKYWSGMSPAMNADNVNTPWLIQVSDDEARALMQPYITLHELQKPVDMYVFQDEYHIKWHPRNRRAVAVRGVDWMRFWLKDEEDVDPAKAEQYARWRKLRELHEANLTKH